MTRTTIETMTLKFRRVVRETTDDKPSLPPFKVVRDTTAEVVEETTKPALAKCISLASRLKRVG